MLKVDFFRQWPARWDGARGPQCRELSEQDCERVG